LGKRRVKVKPACVGGVVESSIRGPEVPTVVFGRPSQRVRRPRVACRAESSVVFGMGRFSTVAMTLPVRMAEGVEEGVDVPESLPVGVRVGVFGGVALLEKETPAVFDAETPVTAGDAVTVKLKESVEEGALADVLVSV
jgi:hypothetical protein